MKIKQNKYKRKLFLNNKEKNNLKNKTNGKLFNYLYPWQNVIGHLLL